MKEEAKKNKDGLRPAFQPRYALSREPGAPLQGCGSRNLRFSGECPYRDVGRGTFVSQGEFFCRYSAKTFTVERRFLLEGAWRRLRASAVSFCEQMMRRLFMRGTNGILVW